MWSKICGDRTEIHNKTKNVFFLNTVLSNGYGSNSPLTPSARISALNIVSDLLRKVGVSALVYFPLSLRENHHIFISFFLFLLDFMCLILHRLWNPNLPLAGTLPRTRRRGRHTRWTTATRSTLTRPATPSCFTHHTLTRRESNTEITHLLHLLTSCRNVPETCVNFFAQQDRDGHIPRVNIWVIPSTC